jgi:hypothetical protein
MDGCACSQRAAARHCGVPGGKSKRVKRASAAAEVGCVRAQRVRRRRRRLRRHAPASAPLARAPAVGVYQAARAGARSSSAGVESGGAGVWHRRLSCKRRRDPQSSQQRSRCAARLRALACVRGCSSSCAEAVGRTSTMQRTQHAARPQRCERCCCPADAKARAWTNRTHACNTPVRDTRLRRSRQRCLRHR